jgi:hypothetical protein
MCRGKRFETHGSKRRLQEEYKSLVFCGDRSCPHPLAVTGEGANAGSSATWSGSRPSPCPVESVSCRAELEFYRRFFEAHGLLRPGQVHFARRQPATVPLAGIRIPHRIRVFRQHRSYTEEYINSTGIFGDVIVSLATLAKQETIRLSERAIAVVLRHLLIAEELLSFGV